MSDKFLHGVEVIQIDDGIRPIQTVRSSVIGLIGTAPNADADVFPLNKPVLLTGTPRKAALLGVDGTLKDALDGIFDQCGAVVVVVRVDEGVDRAATISNILGDFSISSGVHAFLSAEGEIHVTPSLLIAPGFTSIRPRGIGTIEVTNGGSGYSTDGTTVTIAGDGTNATADVVIVGGVVTAINVKNGGIGYSTATVTITGDGTGATATASVTAVANPVVSEMLGLAAKMRAVVIADGPNTTDRDAITYRQDWGSDRLFIVDPFVKIWDRQANAAISEAASARVAGVIAKLDNEKGFWWSPSNNPISGIVGVSRTVNFNLSDANCAANLLNEKRVTTIVHKDGYRLWGNRTASSDPLWTFLSVRRTADMIYESIEAAHLWAMDRPMSAQLLRDIEGGVNAYLRHLKNLGAILGGTAWLDPELNSETELQAGKLYIDFDIEPAAPLEHLIFRAHREAGYYSEMVAEVAATI